VANRLRAEAALRFARTPTGRTADREIDDSVRDPLRRSSLVDGVDVSPVGVTRWAQPWVPLWLDWELEIAVDGRLDRWSLGPVELARPAPATGNSNGSDRGADGADDGDGTLPPRSRSAAGPPWPPPRRGPSPARSPRGSPPSTSATSPARA